MLTRAHNPSLLVMVCALVCSVAGVAEGQTSLAELQKSLNNQGSFSETDFAALAAWRDGREASRQSRTSAK